MRRFNKFFAKKDKPEEHAAASEQTDLASLSPAELMTLVGKYEEEIRKMHFAAQTLTEERDKATQEAMKRIEESKLYKELAESMQEQFQSAAGEVGDLKQVLESKKAEVDVLRGQMITLEEGSNKLKRDLQASEQRGAVLESQLKSAESARVASENEEIAHLRSEVARLSSLVREGLKHEQRVQELEIIKKNMESELLKFSFQAEASSTQLKGVREKLADTTQKLHETELLLQKKQLNLDSFKQEAVSFAFQKESMENEVKAMKEIVSDKDSALERKKEKLRVCKAELLRMRSEFEAVKTASEAKTKDLQSELSHLQQEFSQRVAYDEEVALLKQANFERDLHDKQRELEEMTASLQTAFSKCEERDEKCSALEEQVLELLQTKKALTARLDQCEQEEFKLKAQLDSAQRKREQARAELIKLSQRLEQKPSPLKVLQTEGVDTFFPSTAGAEARVLPRLKRDVDLIYKSLMRAMLTAKDVPYPSEDLTRESVGLLMESELFADVERKVNDLVMNLHEVMEVPDEVECFTESSEPSWSDRITSAVANIKQTVKTVRPVKLFSCMPTSSEKQPPPLTMKPKTEQGRRIMSATGGERKFEQQQAPPGCKKDQSGYKRL